MNPEMVGVVARAFAAAGAGQFDWQARPPPALPAPPLVQHALFESPWVVALALAVAAIIAGHLAQRRGRTTLSLALGGAFAAAAIGVVILASSVRTGREAVLDATVALVDAVARVDEPAMRLMLAENVRLFSSSRLADAAAPVGGLDREGIIARVRGTLGGPYRLREHRTAEREAFITGPNAAVSQLRVKAVPEGYPAAANSYWKLQWRLDPDGWRCVEVTPTSIDGLGSAGP
ncbi:MAG: hypothetical protein ACKVU4_05090 [Phycisphaerales bacterium]